MNVLVGLTHMIFLFCTTLIHFKRGETLDKLVLTVTQTGTWQFWKCFSLRLKFIEALDK